MARPNRYSAANDLFLGTTLTRQTAEHGPVECDVIVFFEVDSFTPGYPQTWMQPAEGPEYELAFTGAAFDPPGEPDDAPGPITTIEVAQLREWFETNHARAAEVANDNFDDRDDYR